MCGASPSDSVDCERKMTFDFCCKNGSDERAGAQFNWKKNQHENHHEKTSHHNNKIKLDFGDDFHDDFRDDFFFN